ncbi:thioredoxin [Candidatus Westeberhardia cardiocondylae]|nr:thioredoxin [Candidatus Westeberhardia cardiocondylae]
MNNNIIVLNEENFKKTIENTKLILVDFWATWCNPCKSVLLILSEIYDEFCEKLIFAKLNVDKNPKITSQHNVRSIPTLILFQNKKIIDIKIGLCTKEEIKLFIKKNIRN